MKYFLKIAALKKSIFRDYGVWILILIGMILRFYGSDHGLPSPFDPDEPFFVTKALHFGKGDLNPHWFGHPGSILMYLMFFIYCVYFIICYIFGIFPSILAFGNSYYQDPTMFYLLGRIIIALFSVILIFLVYIITRKISNRITALISTFFISISYIQVEYSTLIRTDVVSTTFILASIYFMLVSFDVKSIRNFVFAGIFVGLAVAAKYTSGVILISLLIGIILVEKKDLLKTRYLYLSLLAVVMAFFVSTPFFFFDFNTVLSDMSIEANTIHIGSTSTSSIDNYIWYFKRFYRWEMGIVFLLGCIGILLSLIKRKKMDLFLLLFPITYFLIMGLNCNHVVRWMIPITPFIYIYAAKLIVEVYQKIVKTPFLIKNQIVILFLIAIVISIPMIRQVLDYHRYLKLQDTRNLSVEWVKKNIPKGSRIAQEWHTGFFSYEHLYPLNAEIDGDYKITKKYSLSDQKIDFYKQEGYEYLMISGAIYNSFVSKDSTIDLAGAQFYQYLLTFESPLTIIAPDYKKIKGPEIRIYKVN